MKKVVSATEARKHFFQLLRIAGKPGSSVTITLEGQTPLVVMSQEEFEGWMETIEIMSDPELMKDIREAEQETGGVTLEELERKMGLTRHVRRHSQTKGRKAVRKTAKAR